MAEKAEFTQHRRKVTFIDLFAGAGGISEGFLQAYTEDKYFDFVLASDINENCELTHKVRYNRQLGLGTRFIRQDIMEDGFLNNLLDNIGGTEIDVVTGGPSCQSFSLAGERKKFDKRDDLFRHYLKVIKALRPKYFVMENVKGILTKDQGRIKELIMNEIRSIPDVEKIPELLGFIQKTLPDFIPSFLVKALSEKIRLETASQEDYLTFHQSFFTLLEEQLKAITKGISYKESKSDKDVNTIRHGLLLLREKSCRDELRRRTISLKTLCNINNDFLSDSLNDFISSIDDDILVGKLTGSLDAIRKLTVNQEPIDEMADALKVFAMTLDECIVAIGNILSSNNSPALNAFNTLADEIHLYRIDKPIIVMASDYGIPQNRERVLFIGCRKDQRLINSIPSTVGNTEKVSVYEAIWDLDMIKNGESKEEYGHLVPLPNFRHLLRRRDVSGKIDEQGKLYSDWSRTGRLEHRFTFSEEPFYVRSEKELDVNGMHIHAGLFNHQASKQSENVRNRLKIIAECGGYDNERTKDRLKREGLESDKRNYTVLNAEGQSPTVCTMPDDFIHYNSYRPLTVREMARLQSFDDSFVFQGKRQTGGNKRKSEIPQYTLVGNAVPPLMARAIGNEILKNII